MKCIAGFAAVPFLYFIDGKLIYRYNIKLWPFSESTFDLDPEILPFGQNDLTKADGKSVVIQILLN